MISTHRNILIFLTTCLLAFAQTAPSYAAGPDQTTVAPEACFRLYDFSYPEGRAAIDDMLQLQWNTLSVLGILEGESITPAISGIWPDGFSVYLGRPCATAGQDFDARVESHNRQFSKIKVTPKLLPITPKTLRCGAELTDMDCPSANPESRTGIGHPNDQVSKSDDVTKQNNKTPPFPAECFALFKASYPGAISNAFEKSALLYGYLTHLSSEAKKRGTVALNGTYMGGSQIIIWPQKSCASQMEITRGLITDINAESTDIELNFVTNDVDWYDTYCGLGYTAETCPAANNVVVRQ